MEVSDHSFCAHLGELTRTLPNWRSKYKAPEVCKGEYYSPEKAEIFSLGVILFIIMF